MSNQMSIVSTDGVFHADGSNGADGSAPVALIAGVAAGAGCLCLLVVIAIGVWLKRRSQTNDVIAPVAAHGDPTGLTGEYGSVESLHQSVVDVHAYAKPPDNMSECAPAPLASESHYTRAPARTSAYEAVDAEFVH